MNRGTDPLGVPEAPIHLNGFLRSVLRHLTASLEDVIGPDDAEGFVSIVGQRMGHEINRTYLDALSLKRIPREYLSRILIDLKRRIDGEFEVLEERDDRIVIGARRCPFGAQVEGRPALCMMTSNMFGVIAAQSQGYAKVAVEESIARGHGACRITIYLDPRTATGEGRDYYRVEQ